MKKLHLSTPSRRSRALRSARKPAGQHRTVPSSPQAFRNLWMAGLGCSVLIVAPTLVSAKPQATKSSEKAAPSAVSVSAQMNASKSSRGATYNLPLGKTLQFQPAKGFSYRIEEGADNIRAAANDGTLAITPQRVGRATVVVEAPGTAPQTYLVRVVEAAAPAPETLVTTTAVAQTQDPGTTASPTSTTSENPAPVTAEGSSSTAVTSTRSVTSTTNESPAPSGNTTLPALSPTMSPTMPPYMAPVQVSPSLPAPSRLPAGRAPYPTSSSLPRNVANNRNAPRNSIAVTQGLARLLQFRSNILAVFFSDVNVMDARAVNARTVALTGLAPGTSTLAVFSERFPGDAVGQPNIYQISVRSAVGGQATIAQRDPVGVETAIRTALNDPRVGVSVIQLPNGTLAARLTGVLRDAVEVQATSQTAGLFVPQVISSLYTDKNAPSLGEVPIPVQTNEQGLQSSLRQITGNETIELVKLPNGLALKATVNSAADAEALLGLVPTLNQRIMPFIVVRGAAPDVNGGTYYGADRPVLSGEDAALTQRMQDVTGIKTAYIVRTAQNGIAIYGTVRNRREYDSIKRYTLVLPQLGSGAATSGASGTVGGGGLTDRPITQPTAGSQFPRAVQMFVRILDGSDAVIRRVTAETQVVEVRRNALKNLGAEIGTATTLSESIEIQEDGTRLTTRTVDPTLNQGIFTMGNSFGGYGGFSGLDPFRVRFNALYTKGDIRVLSSPNLSAVDGASAQITIGGSRPIPQATVAAGSGTGVAIQNVIFRKYGIILTMRPTLTDDDTIILQIRADITNIDPTTAINLNGAIIPGETVRSVDTTLTVRSGDTIVMGGLITNERNQRTSRIPILSQIPILGALFQSRRFENNESELAIVLTPRILKTAASPNSIADVERLGGLPELPGIQTANAVLQSIRSGADGQ